MAVNLINNPYNKDWMQNNKFNNPFFFGMSNYFKFKPNSLSWLKSTGYYEPKAAHPDYYNWILENVNKGVEGFKGQEGYCSY